MLRILCAILILAFGVEAQRPLPPRGVPRGPRRPPVLVPTIVPGPIFIRPPGRPPRVPTRPIFVPGPRPVRPPGGPPAAPVPEPTTWALLGSGALILGARKRRQLRAASEAGEVPLDDGSGDPTPD